MNRAAAPCLLVLAAACASPDAGSEIGAPYSEPEPICNAVQAATVADRSLIGQASPYPADGMLRASEAELARSPALRRAAAWRAVERAIAPIALAAPLPGQPGATLPRWHTWYGKDDVGRLFHRMYEDLGPERRAGRERFGDDELDAAFGWNPQAVLEDPAWPADRLVEYTSSLDTAAELGAIGGIARIGYSPGAARHLLRSYPEVVRCDGADAPAPLTDTPRVGPRRLAHHAATLSACEARSWGPYFVDGADTLRADVDGSARLELIDESGALRCAAEAGEACDVNGPGAIHVVVKATKSGSVSVNVDYAEANPEWTACLAGQFPLDAAVVKADWRRVWPGDPLPTFDTSQEAVAARLSGAASWDEPDGTAEPGPDTIYTVTTPAGATFRLAGLHLMTKELDHWFWVTLFWSPEPDKSFGSDRPASITAAAGPWKNYQMCVVSAFDEADGSASWCSNPYIEHGNGNAATNCIGCHQHGGAGLTSEMILDTQPAFGVTAVRNNFPADYSWSLDSGDRLLRLFSDEVAWWDAAIAD